MPVDNKETVSPTEEPKTPATPTSTPIYQYFTFNVPFFKNRSASVSTPTSRFPFVPESPGPVPQSAPPSIFKKPHAPGAIPESPGLTPQSAPAGYRSEIEESILLSLANPYS